MRSIWTGAIGFGLVNIPVKLFSATQTSELDLDMLDKKDHAKIKYKRVNENTGEEVPFENIVKGYKYEDQYIVLDDKDFEQASAKKSKIIDISDFVKIEDIDPVYYENPYYLAPDGQAGARAYVLLREALLQTGKVGVATFVMRSKESLSIVRPTKKVIILQRLRFAEEVRSAEELELSENTEVKEKELKMAVSLIDQLTGTFDITAYKNNYAAELMKVIEEKAKGITPSAPEMKVVHSKSQDLMAQLKASLEVKRKKAS